MTNYFLNTIDPAYFYHEIAVDKILLSTVFLLILVMVSSKLISWISPNSNDESISINSETIEINILPIAVCNSISNDKKTTLITRAFVVILILVFIIIPMNEILNLQILL